ncbi:MAG TPA: acetyl-CoA hydrolase/transferase C-terminal domain-containing protein, partial [Desulfoprunum sp.]|nr:acetyl-CoA hydrolase/transferase C-terminal domain-containing protein [Desulfoprunum sp.]
MEYDDNWQTRYRDMIETPKKALAHVRSGHRVFVGTGCGEPTVLVEAMTKAAANLADVEIVHLLTKGDAPYIDSRYGESFKVNSFFIGHNVRAAFMEGRGNYTPILMSDIPRLFDSGQLPLDVALIQVTPPDARGKMSLGISVDIVKSAAENASLVIAQVNPQMPWTRGDSLIDIYDLDILVPADVPLLGHDSRPLSETGRRIVQLAAALVPDGATLEFGLGSVPGCGRITQAVIPLLKDRHDLGIHTELITDEIIDLIASGAVTGAKKSTDMGKIVAGSCMGSRRLYDYINDNPLFSFRPTQYVNDSNLIGRQNLMVTFNIALEIDLTGQVCSDSEQGNFYSGIGGQVDFNRGAAISKGGRPVLLMPSTTEDGQSRIVSRLSAGSGVVISRGTVHYVVTE